MAMELAELFSFFFYLYFFVVEQYQHHQIQQVIILPVSTPDVDDDDDDDRASYVCLCVLGSERKGRVAGESLGIVKPIYKVIIKLKWNS